MVPTQRPTIQSANDVFYVLAGTYPENIDDKGKASGSQGFGPGV
jgi:hypothetical protein